MSYFYREAFLTFLPWFRWSIFGTIAASQRPFRILSAFCGFLFLTRNKPQRTLKTMQRPQGAMGLSFSGLHGQGLQNRILHLLSFAKTFKPFGARFAAWRTSSLVCSIALVRSRLPSRYSTTRR